MPEPLDVKIGLADPEGKTIDRENARDRRA
jgi:hypothetical protein